MKNKFILLSSALLLTFTPMFAGSVKTETQTKNAIHTMVVEGVTLFEVQNYMNTFGIKIVSITPIEGSENVYALSDKGFNYIVYVSQGLITGWDNANY